MKLEPETNRLMLPHLYNARDMGGMMTQSGKKTAYKRFIRSDSPEALSGNSVDELIAYSVRTVIDLRSSSEIERTGNPFINRSEILFRNIPLIAFDPDDRNDPLMSYLVQNNLGHLYILMLEHSRDAVLEVFRTVATAPEGAIVFHCMHGKDRTGLIAALLYLLAGVSKDDIVRNYETSFENIRPLVDPLLEIMPQKNHHMYRSDAENMLILLDYIDRTYGGRADAYLKIIGLSERETGVIRDRLF
jgi:protein tyrosine/serine phosphatase